MRKADARETEQILGFLKQDTGNCVYMVLDISQYGLTHPQLEVYLSECADGEDADKDTFIAMRYYQSYQLYAREGAAIAAAEKEALTRLLLQSGAGMISGPKYFTDQVAQALEEKYDYTSGYVFRFTGYRTFDEIVRIEPAVKEDLKEAARMICADAGIGAHYERDNLTAQLTERMESGMGRNLVIRKEGGGLIGHIATYAEHDGIAVTGGLIATDDGSGIPYGTMLESRLINDLLKEGFRVYTFVTETRRRRFLTAVGGRQIGEYGKLVLRK